MLDAAVSFQTLNHTHTKPMKLIKFAAVALVGLAASLNAQDKAADDKVSATLKGKLIVAQEDKIVDAELKGAPEFYVLYHSASW